MSVKLWEISVKIAEASNLINQAREDAMKMPEMAALSESLYKIDYQLMAILPDLAREAIQGDVVVPEAIRKAILAWAEAKDATRTPQERVQGLQSLESANDFETTDLVKTWAKCHYCEINQFGEIWIQAPQPGHWFSDEEIAGFLAWAESEDAR